MLNFTSASVRIANSDRAVEECLELMFDGQLPTSGVVMFHATLGHRLNRIAEALHKRAPGLTVLGNSCSGVTGREGVGESMSDLAMMAVCGPSTEYGVDTVNEIYGDNAYEKGRLLASALHEQAPQAHTVYLLCPGIDIANDLVVNAFVEVFGEEINIFG